jgi:3-oxoacyl-[acyl-carrier-protein] synthase II
MQSALKKAHLTTNDIDIVNMHATGTTQGDIQECEAIRKLFDDTNASINATKGFIGHAMGAAGALELAGNLPSFNDQLVHSCFGITNLDPQCAIKGLVVDQPIKKNVETILNNSFGMLGINSTLIIKKYHA